MTLGARSASLANSISQSPGPLGSSAGVVVGGDGGGAGTVNTLPQLLQRALRPAARSGSRMLAPHSQLKFTAMAQTCNGLMTKPVASLG